MLKKLFIFLLFIFLNITLLISINLNPFKNSENDQNNNSFRSNQIDSLSFLIDEQSIRIENLLTIIDSLSCIIDSLKQSEDENFDQILINKNFQLPEFYEFAGIKFDLRNERIRNKLQLIFDYEVKKANKYIPRSGTYFPIFDNYFAQYNIPDDARYLAVAESYLSYMAYSSVGAAGIWQFIPSTGKLYNLKINDYLDERRNIFKATEAACKYLNNSNEYLLQREIDDWLLVMASYNAGMGNITRAINEQGAKDFFSLIMRHDETNDYIWRAIAIKIIFENEEKIFGKKFNRDPYLLNTAKLVTVQLNGYHLLNDWAIAQGTNISAIWELNPWIKINKKSQGKYSKINQLMLPPGVFQILIPSSAQADSFKLAEVEKKYQEQTKSIVKNNVIIHKVKKGETLSSIAKKYGVTVTNLKKWNHLKKNNLLKGMKLKINKDTIQDSVYTDNPPQIAQNDSTLTTSVENQTDENRTDQKSSKKVKAKKSYTVKKGDTLYKISKSIGVSEENLIAQNNLKTKKQNGKLNVLLHKGQVLFY